MVKVNMVTMCKYVMEVRRLYPEIDHKILWLLFFNFLFIRIKIRMKIFVIIFSEHFVHSQCFVCQSYY
jgi:hypothetical protein